MRPINDYRDSVYYKLSRKLNYYTSLSNKDPPTTVKNSKKLMEKLKAFSFPPNTKMVSFDVKSLFTSLRMVESKAAVRERLENDDSWRTKTKTKLSIDDISNLIDVCTDLT